MTPAPIGDGIGTGDGSNGNRVLLVVVDGEVIGWATNFPDPLTAAALDEESEQLIQMASNVEEAVELLELGGYTVEIETRIYPRSDDCRQCGKHVGWVISFVGEMFALGWCEDCQPKTEEEARDE